MLKTTHEVRSDYRRILAEPAAPARVSSATALVAFTGLALSDLTLRFRGYQPLRRWLSTRAVKHRVHAVIQDEAAVVLAAVQRAAVYYPKKAMCLQRSIVVTWLLRRRGVSAQMVIGIRHTPFYAHAWVEVDGVVVNDRPSVKQSYPELERI
jgi:hypothetical protein